nr:PD40 domain-containing protein [Mucilaginibacter sp. L294]
MAYPGKLVYHSYACSGTKMYIYNFNTDALTWVSQNWNIDFPMNAHFSPDGTRIVFMGQPAGSGDWDIYLWTVGSSGIPTNLTAGNGLRDEDPKFSPNGYRIAFKQADDLRLMELTGNITDVVTNTSTIEEGIPYYNDDATALLFAQGAPQTFTR